MAKRRYTVDEIDRMREAIKTILTAGLGGSCNPDEVDKQAERQLRTHLLAGTPLKEIEEKARIEEDGWRKRWSAHQKKMTELQQAEKPAREKQVAVLKRARGFFFRLFGG
jgi:hypothetical protein